MKLKEKGNTSGKASRSDVGSTTNKRLNQSPFVDGQLLSPGKLKILVLSGNSISNHQLGFLLQCGNLLKLDLSHNAISHIPSKIDFRLMPRLQILHFNDNRIASIEAIEPVLISPVLICLVYRGNPIQHIRSAEHVIVNRIPSLKVINDRVVFVEERSETIVYPRHNMLVQHDVFENCNTSDNSEEYFLKILSLQLKYLDHVHAFNNPIIIIQRAYRLYAGRKNKKVPGENKKETLKNQKLIPHMTNKIEQTPVEQTILKKTFEDWKQFSLSLRQIRESLSQKDKQTGKSLEHLLEPLEGYRTALRNLRVGAPLRAYLKIMRRRIYEKKMAMRLAASMNIRRVLFNHQSEESFYAFSGIQKQGRFYFSRTQQHLIDNFLAFIGQNFNLKEVIAENVVIRVSAEYVAIRVVDPEMFSNRKQHNSFCTLLCPSMKAVVTNKTKNTPRNQLSAIKIKQLRYLRKRDTHLTKGQYDKSIECYKRLSKFSEDQYHNSFFEFSCSHQVLMSQLIRLIYYHNTKAVNFPVLTRKNDIMSQLQNYKESCIIYVDSILRRVAAAVCIQKTWKRYLNNKKSESIYLKLAKNRAALKIQRFLRDRVFYHRLSFQKRLQTDLNALQGKAMLLQEDVYMSLRQLTVQKNKVLLYKNLRVCRQGRLLGVSEQFSRPVFSQAISRKYFAGRRVGMDNQANAVDIYSVIHFGAEVVIANYNGYRFYSFTYTEQEHYLLVVSILALLSYQVWGGVYMLPLNKDSLDLLPARMQCYKSLRNCNKIRRNQGCDMNKLVFYKNPDQVKLFLFTWDSLLVFTHGQLTYSGSCSSMKSIETQFYQKKYQDFPAKHQSILNYVISSENQQLAIDSQVPIETPTSKYKKSIHDILGNQRIRQELKLTLSPRQHTSELPQVDRKRLSFYDTGQNKLENTRLYQISKTTVVGGQTQQEQKMKKTKVNQRFQQSFLLREAQKQMNLANLQQLRSRSRKDKLMNQTLMNMKELQQASEKKSKVLAIRQFQRRKSQLNKGEEEFILQGNFVMDQQLKMIVMRNKMKDIQSRKQRRSFVPRTQPKKQIDHQSVSSQKSDIHLDSELNVQSETPQEAIATTYKSEARRDARKPRTHSIGAYIRDPTFLHGVFPQEYYPIENRTSSLLFPAV